MICQNLRQRSTENDHYAEAEDRYGIADALRLVGEVALARQNYEQAQHCFIEGLALRRELGGNEGAVEFLLLLSEFERRRANFVAALRAFLLVQTANRGMKHLASQSTVPTENQITLPVVLGQFRDESGR